MFVGFAGVVPNEEVDINKTEVFIVKSYREVDGVISITLLGVFSTVEAAWNAIVQYTNTHIEKYRQINVEQRGSRLRIKTMHYIEELVVFRGIMDRLLGDLNLLFGFLPERLDTVPPPDSITIPTLNGDEE